MSDVFWRLLLVGGVTARLAAPLFWSGCLVSGGDVAELDQVGDVAELDQVDDVAELDQVDDVAELDQVDDVAELDQVDDVAGLDQVELATCDELVALHCRAAVACGESPALATCAAQWNRCAAYHRTPECLEAVAVQGCPTTVPEACQ